MTGPWPAPFVGGHILLTEPGKINNSWDEIPPQWSSIRFDAVDVLFISPFFVDTKDYTFVLGSGKTDYLLKRFEWVIQHARSKNSKVKIIVEEFMGGSANDNSGDYSALNNDGARVKVYANSVAHFLEEWFHKTLPSTSGHGTVSARIDGYEVDVEQGNNAPVLENVLAAVRSSLDHLSTKLSAPKFSVSICPAWTSNLNSKVAAAIDYVDMQRYDGGQSTTADNYHQVMPSLKANQLIWGFSSELTNKNASPHQWSDVEARVDAIAKGHLGVWMWRLNSDNYVYENAFQVWVYNKVHNANLPNYSPAIVAKYWPSGGRKDGKALHDLN